MSEEEYDEIVAPMLAAVAEQVEALGGSIVARVEWERNNAGITIQGVDEESGVAQQLTYLAALSKGNIDTLCIEAMKRFDCSQSIILGRLDQTDPIP